MEEYFFCDHNKRLGCKGQSIFLEGEGNITIKFSKAWKTKGT